MRVGTIEPIIESMDLESIEIKLARSENLPVVSQVAQAIIKVADDPTASPKALERVLEREPAISAKILKVANSAYYGSHVVPSVGRAISVLGINTVRSLVTAISYQQMMGGKSVATLFDKQSFWRHSLAAGTAARILGKLRMPLKAEELYSAGMMHDVGILVMDRFADDVLQKCMKSAVDAGISLREAEQIELGFTHADVGGLLAEKWALTPILHYGIKYHHEPMNAPDLTEAVCIIAAASTLANQCGFRSFRSGPREELDPLVEMTLGMPDDQLEVIRNVLVQEVNRAEAAFGLIQSAA